jgi:hypothetical protein
MSVTPAENPTRVFASTGSAAVIQPSRQCQIGYAPAISTTMVAGARCRTAKKKREAKPQQVGDNDRLPSYEDSRSGPESRDRLPSGSCDCKSQCEERDCAPPTSYLAPCQTGSIPRASYRLPKSQLPNTAGGRTTVRPVLARSPWNHHCASSAAGSGGSSLLSRAGKLPYSGPITAS